jgi:hypothetical protein
VTPPPAHTPVASANVAGQPVLAGAVAVVAADPLASPDPAARTGPGPGEEHAATTSRNEIRRMSDIVWARAARR